jgi:hypothetical protein
VTIIRRAILTAIIALAITACGPQPRTQLCPGGPLHTQCARTP